MEAGIFYRLEVNFFCRTYVEPTSAFLWFGGGMVLSWTNNQMNTYQITKCKFTKQPNKNLPNNQIIIKFFVCFIEKMYFCTKLLLYGRAF